MESSGSRDDSSIGTQPGGPSPEGTEARPLVEAKKGRGPKILTAVLVAIIVVLAAALAYVEFTKPTAPAAPSGQLSIQSTAPTAQQGSAVTFQMTNLRSDAYALVSTGDGQVVNTSSSSFTHIYDVPGAFLVYAREFGATNNTGFASTANALIKVTVVPTIPPQVAQYLSAPTIYFNTSLNPNAPLVGTGSQLSLYGGYGEVSQLLSSTSSFLNLSLHTYNNVTDAVTVDHYSWDFGNGQTLVVPADPNTLLPAQNPVTQSYPTPGFYTAELTLWTTESLTAQVTNVLNGMTFTNTTTINTYSETLAATIAVGTFSFASTSGNVPNPKVITEIVNSPGGPYSFDPQIDYETTGFEVVVNTQATLLIYNSNSTTSWIPYVAATVPSVGNGVSSDSKNYTFQIRSGMGFSNGHPITAYDVWYTMIRTMLFQGGTPGTADWILSQYLIPRNTAPFFAPFVPIVNGSNKAAAFSAIMASVSYNNASQTVTFHLVNPTAPALFFTTINDALGTGILDAAWLVSIGAGITFTPDGFLAYENQGVEGNYNTQVQFHPVTSGPYEINTYVPSTSVVLTPNPYFPGVPSLPKQNNTVILDWVSEPSVAYQLFASGQGDIVTLLPPPYFPTINNTLVKAGQARIEGPFASITEFFAVFNVNITTSLLATDIGPGFSIPADYFANPLVREAFAYTFNYTNYVDQILGNKKYGFNFGSPYCGVIVQGLPYYVPPSGLPGCPAFDLAKAKSLLYQSGMYNVSVNFPIVVPTGDTTDYTASLVYAAALNSIDPHIVMSPAYVAFDTIIGLSVPGANPMPLYFLGWIADYPYPSDYTDAMYLQGGTYPAPNGWDQTFLNGLAAAHPAQASLYNQQAMAFSNLTTQITAADTATSGAAQLYATSEQTAVKLYMYVYTEQANGFWIVKSYMKPYNNDWGFQENPTIGAGADSTFFWWIKG